MMIHDLILELWPHFLPMCKIKSRSSVFSIFKRWFSYLYSCSVLAGFLPLCFGIPCISFFRSRFSKSWIGRSPFKPNFSATSRWLIPLSSILLISGSSSCIFWYLLGIENPPWCSFIFLHQGGLCLLSVFTGSVQRPGGLFSPWKEVRSVIK